MLRAIYILRRRQVKRFFRNKARLLWSIWQPLLMIIAFWAGFSGLFEAAWQTNYIGFLAAWIIATNTMMSSIWAWMDLIWDKDFWFIKEYLVAPVKRIWIMIWKTLWWATTGLLQWIILLILCMCIWIDVTSRISIPVAILFMIWIAIVFTAFWLIFASLVPDFQWFQIVNNFLIMPLMMLSWAFYPLSTAAPRLQRVAKFNPLAYWVDWIRWALTWDCFFGSGMNFLVIWILMIVVLFIWAKVFNRIKADN